MFCRSCWLIPIRMCARHAVRISEPQLMSSPQLAAAVMHLAIDDDAFVRLQVAYSSAFLRAADSAQALAALMKSDGGNAHLKSAEESALTADNVVLVMQGLKQTSAESDAMDRLLVNAATLGDADALKSVLSELSALASAPAESEIPATEHITRLSMFIDAWSRRVPQEFAPDGEVLRSIWKPVLDSAVLIMESENSGLQLRAAAVRLAGLGPFLGEPHAASLAALLTPAHAAPAAVRRD